MTDTGNPAAALQGLFMSNYFQIIVFPNSGWTPNSFSVAENARDAEVRTGAILNSVDPNLRPFESRRGKLIQYVGWSDSAISPYNDINYVNSVAAEMAAIGKNRLILPSIHGAWYGPLRRWPRSQCFRQRRQRPKSGRFGRRCPGGARSLGRVLRSAGTDSCDQVRQPHFWLALYDHNEHPGRSLREAIRLDPAYGPARAALAQLILKEIECNQHELPSGYLGNPADDLIALSEAQVLVAKSVEPPVRARLEEQNLPFVPSLKTGSGCPAN
jgi:hypothetical protein